jgi:uncharacterized protein (DUF486 family)
MTLAWYGHLNFKAKPLILVVMASWGIAFIEYCLAVPANRYGHALYSAAELKTIQEVVTLIVFCGFSVLYLKEPLGWNHAIGFALIGRRLHLLGRGHVSYGAHRVADHQHHVGDHRQYSWCGRWRGT